MRSADAKVSVVVPFLDEEANLPALKERVAGAFAGRSERWQLVLVDDGSSDGGTDWARKAAEEDGEHVRLVRLSRNFGHQLAITAGLDLADGDAVAVMDADLQDPPETLGAMLDKWREGADVVYAVRRKREGETWSKKVLAAGFYRVFRRLSKVKMPVDAGDFRLMDRRVVDAVKQMRELHRFMRGMTSWVGFRQESVEYDRAARAAGKTKYPVWKSAKLALDALTSFSGAPLRWIAGMGVATCLAALVWGAYIVASKIWGWGESERGWSSLMVTLVFFSGVQLLGLGMVGQYVSRIFEEGKRRPLYWVAEDSGAE
jgi:dolichol-phosphate mannosyltransferase